MPAALTVAAGAALSSPLAAQAGVTPSLKNLINSVIAGAHTWRFWLAARSCILLVEFGQRACNQGVLYAGW